MRDVTASAGEHPGVEEAADADAPTAEPTSTTAPPSRVSRRSLVGLLAAVVACLPYLLDLYRLLASRANAYPLQQDQAVEALNTLDASRFHQLLGPYDRFGWHHPGPALFYLLALPYRAFGARGPGMYVGVVLLDIVAVGAIVIVVSHRWGALLGLWSAVCLTVLRLSLGAAVFWNPWNPYVVVLPTVLFVVLAGDGATGSTPSLAWAVVVGSFVVQTDISTAPVVVVLLVIAAVAWQVPRRRGGTASVATTATVSAAAVAALMWLPPLIDAFKGRGSNVYQIAEFFTSSHPTHSLASAASSSLASVTSVPFGIHYGVALNMTRAHGQLFLGGAAIGLLAIAALAVSRARRQRFGTWLAVVSLAGFVIGVVSATRIDGPIFYYLSVWQVFVPITLLLALGASVLAPATPAAVAPPPGILARLGDARVEVAGAAVLG